MEIQPLPVSQLSALELERLFEELTPYRQEFRGPILCAVNRKGEVIIKGLLRYSTKKDNAAEVVRALNLTHSRGQVAGLNLCNSREVVSTYLSKVLKAPADVLEIAVTFICDEFQLDPLGRNDCAKVIQRFSFYCKTKPQEILACIKRAEAIVALDSLDPSCAVVTSVGVSTIEVNREQALPVTKETHK